MFISSLSNKKGVHTSIFPNEGRIRTNKKQAFRRIRWKYPSSRFRPMFNHLLLAYSERHHLWRMSCNVRIEFRWVYWSDSNPQFNNEIRCIFLWRKLNWMLPPTSSFSSSFTYLSNISGFTTNCFTAAKVAVITVSGSGFEFGICREHWYCRMISVWKSGRSKRRNT